MPLSRLGPQPVAPQVHQSQPTQQQQQQHQQQQPTRQPQQKEHYHSGSIHARDRGKSQETMQKERNTGTLQRHQHTKDIVRQPQRQGPQKQSNRHHLPYKPNKLPQCLHRRVRQITRWKSQGTFQGPLPIHLHSTITGHPMDPEQFNIVHKEVNNQSRTIKEAMFICVQDPTLNRNLGKDQLLHIWNHLLMASPTLQCEPSGLHLPPTPNSPPTGSPTLLLPIQVGGIYYYSKYTHLAIQHPIHP